MKSTNKRLAQKSISVMVIVTILYGVGVAPIVMMFVTGLVLVVFMVSRRAHNKEVERIFDFYLAAEAILRDEDRRWYGFEVTEVIATGEMTLEEIPDPPPLLLFTLGALHHLIGKPFVHGANRCRISAENMICKCIHLVDRDRHRYESTPDVFPLDPDVCGRGTAPVGCQIANT